MGRGARGEDANASSNSGVSLVYALVAVHSPEDMQMNYTGLYATFSVQPPPPGEFVAWAPAGDPEGCSAYSVPSGLSSGDLPAAAVIRRGTCTFTKKSQLAQEAGAKALIIVGDNEDLTIMGTGENQSIGDLAISIPVVSVPKSTGEKIIARARAAGENGTEQVVMSFDVLTEPAFDPMSILDVSEALLVLMATSLVVAGAFVSTADLRQDSPIKAAPEEVVEMDNSMGVGFCLLGSCALLLLFYFIQYLIYVIMFFFCVGGVSCMVMFGSAALSYLFPSVQRHKAEACGCEVGLAEVLAAIPAVCIVVSWVLLRNTPYGWIFQDLIGACFLCSIQRTLRLPNMMIATVFLSIMFCFDIWWVFISPLLFTKSVMVTVATGGDTHESVPMLLRIPAMADGHDRLLGFGDIALPGLLISFLRRHDLQSRRKWTSGYFLPAVIGYFVGLCATIAALMIMEMGQPALLYLVPGTVGTTLLLGCCRGDLRHLWTGAPSPIAGGALNGGGDCGDDWL